MVRRITEDFNRYIRRVFRINTLKYANLSNDKIPMQKRTVIGTYETEFKGLLYDRHPQVRQSIRNSKRV